MVKEDCDWLTLMLAGNSAEKLSLLGAIFSVEGIAVVKSVEFVGESKETKR